MWAECDVPVLGIFLFFDGIGTGIRKIWYRKVSELVLKKIWYRKKSLNQSQRKFSFEKSSGTGLGQILDDQHRNTNINDKDHLVGQLTT